MARVRQIAEASVKITGIQPGHFTEFMRKASKKDLGVCGRRLRDAARRRVAPGVGPGPHPHRTKHVDTGNLMNQTVYRITQLRDGWQLEVGPKGGGYYGTYLELGWHTKSGTFYKYPWLRPALKEQWPWISNYMLMKQTPMSIRKYLRSPSNLARSVRIIKG